MEIYDGISEMANGRAMISPLDSVINGSSLIIL